MNWRIEFTPRALYPRLKRGEQAERGHEIQGFADGPLGLAGRPGVAGPAPAADARHRDRRAGGRRRHHRRDGRRRAFGGGLQGRGRRPPRAGQRLDHGQHGAGAIRHRHAADEARAADRQARCDPRLAALAARGRCAGGEAERAWRRRLRAATRSISPATCSTPASSSASMRRVSPQASPAACSRRRELQSDFGIRSRGRDHEHRRSRARSARHDMRLAARGLPGRNENPCPGRHRRHRCQEIPRGRDGGQRQAHPLKPSGVRHRLRISKERAAARAHRSHRPGPSPPCRSRAGSGRASA